MRFNNYITEEVSQITHLTHLEDLLLTNGIKGFYIFKDIVTKILSGSNDDVIYQAKIDGSPALFFGVDPIDNKFFISTKSLFNKNPKVAKTSKDINTLFKGGLANKLQDAFKYLSKVHINPDVVYQGDIIFSRSDKQNTTIDGIDYITFKPNTLTYAVSKSLDIYDKIDNAEFGIVVHTMYKIAKRTNDGFQLSTVPYNFKSITSQSNNDLFITSNLISGVKVKDTQAEEILSRVDAIEQVVNSNNVLEDLTRRDEKISIYIQTFINAQLDRSDLGIFGSAKDNRSFTGDSYFSQMFDWVMGSYDRDTNQKDVGDTKMLRDRMYKVMLSNKRKLILFLWCFYGMLNLKYKILAMFDDTNVIGKTYKDVGGKLQSTAGEGIVILHGDSIIKLVDRAEFSALNRRAHR